MKIGQRGQVTIPKDLRERFSLSAETEVEFLVQRGELVIRKKVASRKGSRRSRIESCVGILEGQPDEVDGFIEEIRGR